MPAKNLFGTSGIRGDAEVFFTDQFCFDIGRTFAQFLNKHRQDGAIAVGMDPRGTSPRICDAFIDGVVFEGREVVDEGAVPAPAMCYILQVAEHIVASAIVTGSHIKANLNGIKFFAFESEILKVHEGEINEIYALLAGKDDRVKRKREVESSGEAKFEYEEMLVAIALPKFPKWKVLVDCGNGSQSDIMPQVLGRLGITVIEQNATIQGKFHARDTENIEDLKEVIAKVPEVGADFGVAYDADGDRAVFFDKYGNFIPGDNSAAIVAKHSPSDTVVTPVATSSVVDHIGKKVIRTKVGSPHVVESMRKYGSKIGFEANGGVFSGEIMYTRDGGSTTIKFLNILARSGETIEELIGELPKYYLVKAKVDYKWELQDKILKGAKAKFKGEKVEEIDGLKIWLDKNTWMLFRSSKNAPEFRIFAESTNEAKANNLLKRGVDYVNGVIGK